MPWPFDRSRKIAWAGMRVFANNEPTFMVFDVTTGEVLMDETQYKTDTKYEGVEFVNIYTPEPTY